VIHTGRAFIVIASAAMLACGGGSSGTTQHDPAAAGSGGSAARHDGAPNDRGGSGTGADGTGDGAGTGAAGSAGAGGAGAEDAGMHANDTTDSDHSVGSLCDPDRFSRVCQDERVILFCKLTDSGTFELAVDMACATGTTCEETRIVMDGKTMAVCLEASAPCGVGACGCPAEMICRGSTDSYESYCDDGSGNTPVYADVTACRAAGGTPSASSETHCWIPCEYPGMKHHVECAPGEACQSFPQGSSNTYCAGTNGAFPPTCSTDGAACGTNALGVCMQHSCMTDCVP
jgi:hypothetical protein